jgi:hypothetical protein
MIKGTIMLCAWLLWAHWAGGPGSDGKLHNLVPHFEIVQGYESRAECEEIRKKTRLTPGYDRLVCLPDTVKDPR